MSDAERKRFRVTTVLSVRAEPSVNGTRSSETLEPGREIDVEPDSRHEADGFVWWKHNAGWSAERRIDGAQIFMEPVMVKTAQTGTVVPARRYRVTRSLSVRAQPGLKGQRLPDPLEPDTEIEIDPDSRQEVDGFIWWKHGIGWSAERSTDGAHIFMEPLPEKTSSEASPKVQDAKPEAAESTSTAPSTDKPESLEKTRQTGRLRAFKVMQTLSVRTAPGLTAQRLPDVLPVGAILNCDEESRREVDGYIWWQHDRGWSAELKTDGSVVFLRDPDAVPPVNADGSLNIEGLPQRGALFQRIPVDLELVPWVQYFGNTKFAFENGRAWNYPAFSQGLHSGLDLAGRHDKIPVFAGVEGTFIRNNGFGIAVRAGEYVIIYQHLTNNRSYVQGGQVKPDTVLGEMDPSLKNNRHLHLEVRYDREKWIVNPLLLMPVPMRNEIMGRYANFPAYFYHDHRWNQWLNPLDQPVILRGGPVIGPLAG